MQDDATRGTQAHIEIGNETWPRHRQTGSHTGAPHRTDATPHLQVRLSAVVLSVLDGQPVVQVCDSPQAAAASPDPMAPFELPAGRFDPPRHHDLEMAVRDAVRAATGLQLGYVEQLLTDFDAGPTANTGPHPAPAQGELAVTYLALARAGASPPSSTARWLDCYDLLPWEDFRNGRPACLDGEILPPLNAWAAADPLESAADPTPDCSLDAPSSRHDRLHMAFSPIGQPWDDQRTAERLNLIDEAGLAKPADICGLSTQQRALVAAGLGRLRSKLRYRPVVFELLPEEFTLFELQRTVEAVLGPALHKQNFRRLVEGTRLVEPTGDVRSKTGGRPAKTFRFRREVLLERPMPGVHIRPGRAA